MTDYRITFSKKGPLIFISHLDLNHSFIRALNRAFLSVNYSQGFNPHPKIVFALPLSVGMSGENELCDITFTDDNLTSGELYERLKAVLPPYIEIKEVGKSDKKFKDISCAEYKVLFDEASGVREKVSELFKGPLVVTKTTKSGEKQVDISPQIRSFSINETKSGTELKLTLDSSPDSYLNPEYVITALKSAEIIDKKQKYTLSREKILFKEGL